MSWAKLDDSVATHPKISRLDSDALVLWVMGLCYCQRHLTDGAIPAHIVPTLAPNQVRRPTKATGTLVQVGLWHPTVDGFQVHDYLDWNDSRAATEARKARDRARKRGVAHDSARNPRGIPRDSRCGVESSSVLGESPREPSALEARFASWWERYPRKVGRQAAWREWQKLKPSDETLVEMLAVLTLQRQSQDWVKEGGRFIPHPKTYLHQGRWEDLVEATREPEPIWERWDECAQCGDVHKVGGPCKRGPANAA